MRKILFITVICTLLFTVGNMALCFAQVHKNIKEKQKLVRGGWVSTQDNKSEIALSATEWKDYYNKKFMGADGYFFVNNSDTICRLFNDDTLFYHIEDVDEYNLSLSYLGMGRQDHSFVQVLDYVKKKK